MVSTLDTPVEHTPVQALGGGDAWLGGFLASLLEARVPLPARPRDTLPEDDEASAAAAQLLIDALHAACRRGDLLAALHLATHGDLSYVTRRELLVVEHEFRGTTARLVSAIATAAASCSSESQAGATSPVAPPPRVLPPVHTKSAAHNDHLGGSSAAHSGSTPAADAVIARISLERIVPVVTLDDPADAVAVAQALCAGGLSTMELTLRTPGAEACLRAVADEVPKVLLGAGTVLSPEHAARAVAAGARFLVSPGTNPAVVRWAHAHGIPLLPGAATATEIDIAGALGHDVLKFFPAEAAGGVKALAALSAPYSHVRFMPTGGINITNLRSYTSLKSVIAAGCSWLAPPHLVRAKDWGAITALAVAAADEARAGASGAL
jgi:2-dehydro-3-deoxyphosphogluconate aldolase/(4S)-4-hydroxy-2-oxoglutarate aldolase